MARRLLVKTCRRSTVANQLDLCFGPRMSRFLFQAATIVDGHPVFHQPHSKPGKHMSSNGQTFISNIFSSRAGSTPNISLPIPPNVQPRPLTTREAQLVDHLVRLQQVSSIRREILDASFHSLRQSPSFSRRLLDRGNNMVPFLAEP
jgi:hypothetical protein